jgi:hypothetical protein
MIEWVVVTKRDVKVALEKANLNGFVYDASFQLHPGVYPMQRDPKNVGGGGKTAQKSTSSTAPPLCNFCGGNHTMDACRRKGFPDTNADTFVKWIDSAVGKAWKTDTIATGVRVDQRSTSRITRNRASKRKRKLAVLPNHRLYVNDESHLHYHVYACTVSK